MIRTAPMAGGGAYNRHSQIQLTGLMPAVDLLRQALAQGSPSFMAHIVPELAASTHPQIRALVAHLTP